MGVIRMVRPVNIPVGNEENTLSVSCIVIVYEYLHRDSDTTFPTWQNDSSQANQIHKFTEIATKFVKK